MKSQVGYLGYDVTSVFPGSAVLQIWLQWHTEHSSTHTSGLFQCPGIKPKFAIATQVASENESVSHAYHQCCSPWGTGHTWSSCSFHFPKSFCLLESTLLHVFLPMSRSHLKATDTAALPLLRADLLSAFSTALLCTLCPYPVYVRGVAELNGLCMFRLSPVWLSLVVKGAKYHLEWWSVAEKQRPWSYCQRAMGTLYLHCEILIALTSDFKVLFWGQPCSSWRSRVFVGCVESGESWRELERHYPEISSCAFGQKLWMVVSRDSCVLEGGSNKMMKEWLPLREVMPLHLHEQWVAAEAVLGR